MASVADRLVDPDGVAAISRGFRAAVPPVT